MLDVYSRGICLICIMSSYWSRWIKIRVTYPTYLICAPENEPDEDNFSVVFFCRGVTGLLPNSAFSAYRWQNIKSRPLILVYFR